jgi:hypothetical protein
LVYSELLDINEFFFKDIKILVIQLELELEGAIRYPFSAMEHLDGLL